MLEAWSLSTQYQVICIPAHQALEKRNTLRILGNNHKESQASAGSSDASEMYFAFCDGPE
jgi:hypothetical protein